ncbi:Uncharacterised protein [Mycobacteroides abscessus subsp. bolletii]|uniref:PPE family protein n=1 Tax=Mycobacteroides abscessus subsp. bolletii TaxID=319705 RepID=A0A9Q7WII7_9MYCO|nr:hypothetical protein [Mycobacteroides abscessus]SHU25771.1 Uncharacterised protein [Mycobacteroides abscessus subsp. bolletii]SHV21868.1 Uncharacterised protein [Mycobacteroides abscessus subsp. bolletii]SHX21137.1 Uncharacterised protein [Mycobacteroides abscessus subsp. bolletii]SKL37919.1 Uncharacterised protein [Mycobacteroides abscessus subsp. bolletii]SKM62733.1 Uncharacterised protein [Mycobacteroides abscessus subsp. bolletii]
MADDGWQSRSHADIVGKLGALKADNAFTLANTWSDVYTKLSDAAVSYGNAKSKLAEPDFWTGKGPEAALDEMTTKERELTSESGTSAKAGKMSTALFQDGEVLSQSSRVAQAYPVPPDDTDADSKKKLLEAVRAEAQRLYTSPLEADRPKFTEDSNTTASGPMPAGPGGNNGGGGGSGSGGSGSGTQTPPSSSDGLASKDTKPQLAGGEGQQAGAGQGQGGQGSGSGGGTPGGGQGAGSGGAGSGLSSGSGGSGLPIGSTTAAGFSPSSAGTGVGGSGSGVGGPSGLSALRGGAGLPGGAAAGAGGGGVNPAGVGAAGVRGMGPMGMMGGAGGHGRGGKGEDDDDHATPQILINYDNTDEFMGDMPAASPGVIGDWSEQEKAEKAAREREVRRYKALGWDVKFE